MSCVQNPKTQSVHLEASSANDRYYWFTGWLPATGFDAIKAVVRNMASTANFNSRLAIQTATVRADSPDSPSMKEAGYHSGGGQWCTTVIDVSGDTASKFLVRVGVAYKSGDGNFAQADVALDLSYFACGQLVGSRTFHVYTAGTGDQYEPLTGWIPALLADKVKAVIVLTGAAPDFQCELAYRTATTTKEEPSAWAAVTGDSWHNPGSANGEYNTRTPDIPPPLS